MTDSSSPLLSREHKDNLAPLRVLVVYASLHGSTRSIAEFLGRRLAREFSIVDTMSVEEARQDRPVSLYDAIVLGSAVHNMAWLPVMMDYIVDNEAELAKRPVWLFSVSAVGDTTSFFARWVASAMRPGRTLKNDDWLKSTLYPRGYRNFAGVAAVSRWGLLGACVALCMCASVGDHRDWDDVARWGDSIAQLLKVVAREKSGGISLT